jgi:catechol 2,3-dioxygenase-like lactoylglutathione lyase family enzyme
MPHEESGAADDGATDLEQRDGTDHTARDGAADSDRRVEATSGSDPVRPDGGVGPLDVVDMDHVAIRVSDLDRSLAFYRDRLGLPERDRDRFEAGEVPFVAVAAGGRHLHLVPSDEPVDVGGEHVCLLVRSTGTDTETQLRELLSQLTAAGVDVESGEPVLRYGAYGRDWAAYVRDPDGRRVELKVH